MQSSPQKNYANKKRVLNGKLTETYKKTGHKNPQWEVDRNVKVTLFLLSKGS